MPWISSLSPSTSVTGTPTNTHSGNGPVKVKGIVAGQVEMDGDSFCLLNMPTSCASSDSVFVLSKRPMVGL